MKLSLLFPSGSLVTSMKLGLVFPDHEPGRPAYDDAPLTP
jgi:hypothetical protein